MWLLLGTVLGNRGHHQAHFTIGCQVDTLLAVQRPNGVVLLVLRRPKGKGNDTCVSEPTMAFSGVWVADSVVLEAQPRAAEQPQPCLPQLRENPVREEIVPIVRDSISLKWSRGRRDLVTERERRESW